MLNIYDTEVILFEKKEYKKLDIIALLISIMSFVIPVLCVFIAIKMRIAQGEKEEGIIGGLIIGWAIGFIFSIISLILTKKSQKRYDKKNKINNISVICSIIGILPFPVILVMYLIYWTF